MVALTLHPRPVKAKAFLRGEVREACEWAVETVEDRAARRARRGPMPSGLISAAELV